MDRRSLIRQIVGPYENVRLREQGADGSVIVEARDSKNSQPVTIRIFPTLLGSEPQISSRFRRLAEAVRQLNHPIIVGSEIGEESGLPYAVTQVLQRLHPLAQRIDQPWAVETVAGLAESVGEALEHAFRRGVMHGNLNPDNILLDEEGQVRITDLGLSQLKDLLGGSVRDTVSPYLAPEHAAGQPATPASDVYSLGVIVYALLARRLPAAEGGKLVPASQFNADLTPRLDAVLERALSVDPEKRYPSVGEFVGDLRQAAVPTVATLGEARDAVRCPNCGTAGQTGRYCRTCGRQLRPAKRPSTASMQPPAVPKSKLDEPIQQTRIEIGSGAEVLRPIETTPIQFDVPVAVAGDSISADFPEPLPMPQLSLEQLWPETSGHPPIVMPAFLAMPEVNWEDLVPPPSEVPELDSVGPPEVEEEPEA